MTLLLNPRHASSSLLAGLLESPIEFDPPMHRSTMIVQPGTRAVLVGPRSPRPGHKSLAEHKIESVASSSSSQLHVVSSSSTPSRKGKEPARPVDLSWPASVTKTNRAGAGLRNPSMACYANATLQVLLHTPPVLHQALTHSSEDCKLHAKGFCMMCALSTLAARHWKHEHYSPNEVHNNLPKIRKGFSKHRQEDTHEFFRFVTDGLQASATAHLPKNASEQVKQDTWVNHTWGGQVRSRVICSKCNKPSDTFDSFLDLSLDVNKGGRPSLFGMLKGFVREDKLEGDNKYHCSNCKSKANATKSFSISRAPPVLTFHLKRFNINYEYGRARAQKYNQMIDYPEAIDIAPFMIEQNHEGTKYRLVGVTCHRGAELRFGHYTSYVRGPGGQWSHADDEDITRVSPAAALNDKTAYVLSYVRVSDEEYASIAQEAPSELNKRKREESTDKPFKRIAPSSDSAEQIPSKSYKTKAPSPTPVSPHGSPQAPQFGYKPKVIQQSSFYGKTASREKKHMSKKQKSRAPMPFSHGQRDRRKGMISKMQRR